MPTYLSGTQSLPIYQLIGTPLVAMVEGDALAAHATAEFIESVGFVKDSNTPTGSFGKVKTVTFSYQRHGINGEVETQELVLPVLSLITIPMLQIKDASLSFNLKITEVVTSDSSQNKAIAGNEVFPLTETYKQDNALSMNGLYASSNTETQTSVDVKMQINVTRADLPVGFTKLFQAMEVASTSQPSTVPPPIIVDPDDSNNDTDPNNNTPPIE